MIARYALLTSAAFAACAAWAQPNLTAATSVPVTGDDYAVNSANSFLSPGPMGAAQTFEYWNMINQTNGNQTIKFRAVTAAHTTAVPSATYLRTDGGSDTLFYTVTSNGVELVGAKTGIEGTFAYSDPIVELALPCTFGTTWSDQLAATYITQGSPPFGGLTVTRVGTLVGAGDAYGTLTMPWGLTYPDVLRVKVRSSIQDNSSLTNVSRVVNAYYYFVPTSKFPIVTLTEDSTTSVLGLTVAKKALWQGNPVMVSVDEISPDQFTFTAYPNPATDQLNIAFAEGRNVTTRLEVLDAAGRVVLTRTMTGDRAAMDTQSLRAGHYSVRAFAGDQLIGVRPLVVD